MTLETTAEYILQPDYASDGTGKDFMQTDETIDGLGLIKKREVPDTYRADCNTFFGDLGVLPSQWLGKQHATSNYCINECL